MPTYRKRTGPSSFSNKKRRSSWPAAPSATACARQLISESAGGLRKRSEPMKEATFDNQNWPRKSLLGNAIFSFLSGTSILFLNRSLVGFLGLPENVSLVALGIALFIYSFILLLNVMRPQIKLS